MVFSDLGFHAEEKAWGKEGSSGLKLYFLFRCDSSGLLYLFRLCEGRELLDRILARGGRYIKDDAKDIVVQILSVVSFCHLHGVVHRDLKPENFLFTSGGEDADMKLIDFDLFDFIRPGFESVSDLYHIISTILFLVVVLITIFQLMEQHRLETTMQSKIRVYESGRTEQGYDPDLPPELAATTGQEVRAVLLILESWMGEKMTLPKELLEFDLHFQLGEQYKWREVVGNASPPLIHGHLVSVIQMQLLRLSVRIL